MPTATSTCWLATPPFRRTFRSCSAAAGRAHGCAPPGPRPRSGRGLPRCPVAVRRLHVAGGARHGDEGDDQHGQLPVGEAGERVYGPDGTEFESFSRSHFGPTTEQPSARHRAPRARSAETRVTVPVPVASAATVARVSSPSPGAWTTVTPALVPSTTPGGPHPRARRPRAGRGRAAAVAARMSATRAAAAPARSRHHPFGREPTTLAASTTSTVSGQTYWLRKAWASAVSSRWSTLVALQKVSPVVVMATRTPLRNTGPPESPLQVPASPVAGFWVRRR